MSGTRTILHVDMDAFYASVEQRDNPDLRGKPLIVGGPSRRGVVTAASYEVRPFGVRSAMSMVEALRRAPHAIVVPGRHERYEEVSREVFAVFRRFTPLVEGLSVDEAFLDVTASRALFGDGAAIASRIRAAIRSEVGITASAGVAPSKFVAKIASDQNKPDGLTVVEPEEVAAFLAPLPIERMWGVGPRTAPRLHAHGLSTFADLIAAGPERLEQLLGSWGRYIHALARGNDDRAVEPHGEAKSIGAEETYDDDLTTRRAIEVKLLDQAGRVARRLHDEGISASCIHVKLKYADFTLLTRQMQLRAPVADTDSIYEAARTLLERFPLRNRRVRLTGVAASHLHPGPPPPTLFPDERAMRRQKVEDAVAVLREKFGDKRLVTRAALLGEGGDED